jgi:thiol-disulfide isomerase/thioredoxin
MTTVGLPIVIVAVLVVLVILLNGGAQGGGKVAPPGSIKVAGASLPVPSDANPTPAIGMTVPTFSAPDLNGGTVGWEPGKPTVLTVWAAWCPHCQVELPKLDKIRSQYPGVQVISINTGQGQQPGPVPADFIAKNNITMPVAIDDSAKTLLQAMGVSGFPALYFINSDGTILDQLAGEPDDATLQANFEKLQQQADGVSSSGSTTPSPKPSK